MHYSIIRAAGCAFLGLSAVLLGGASFPTGVHIVERASSEVSVQKVAARAKPVPRLSSYEYTARSVQTFAGRPARWTITKRGVNGYIDEITIDKSSGIIHVENANNKDDRTSNRLSLSDIAMSLFVHESEKQPSDLKSLVFERISEDATLEILKPMLEEAGYHPTNPDVTIIVTPESEKFADLEVTPFGKVLWWLNEDFGVPRVTSYTIPAPKKLRLWWQSLGSCRKFSWCFGWTLSSVKRFS